VIDYQVMKGSAREKYTFAVSVSGMTLTVAAGNLTTQGEEYSWPSAISMVVGEGALCASVVREISSGDIQLVQGGDALDASMHDLLAFAVMGEVPEGTTSLDDVALTVVQRVAPETPPPATPSDFFSYLTST